MSYIKGTIGKSASFAAKHKDANQRMQTSVSYYHGDGLHDGFDWITGKAIHTLANGAKRNHLAGKGSLS